MNCVVHFRVCLSSRDMNMHMQAGVERCKTIMLIAKHILRRYQKCNSIKNPLTIRSCDDDLIYLKKNYAFLRIS